jgi:hypothetical protein
MIRFDGISLPSPQSSVTISSYDVEMLLGTRKSLVLMLKGPGYYLILVPVSALLPQLFPSSSFDCQLLLLVAVTVLTWSRHTTSFLNCCF